MLLRRILDRPEPGYFGAFLGRPWVHVICIIIIFTSLLNYFRLWNNLLKALYFFVMANVRWSQSHNGINILKTINLVNMYLLDYALHNTCLLSIIWSVCLSSVHPYLYTCLRLQNHRVKFHHTWHKALKMIQFCSNEGQCPLSKADNSYIVKIHWQLLLQNYWANFNQIWHRTSLS